MNIAEFALSKIGQGYIYGAKGQTCSPKFRKQQAEQYPEQAQNILVTGAKWDGMPVWDCAQLTRYAAKAEGLTLPSGATSQWEKGAWAEKGQIATIPAGKTVFVYRKSGDKMQHTGIAIGDGTCVHARGTAYGVVRQRMAECPWTHWGLLKSQQKGEDAMETNAMITSGDGNPVKLRADPSTKNAYVEKLPVGTAVSVIEKIKTNDGKEWAKIAVFGRVGYVMGEYLNGAEKFKTDGIQTETDGSVFLAEINRKIDLIINMLGGDAVG